MVLRLSIFLFFKTMIMKIVFASLLFFTALSLHAQQDLIDTIAIASCNCAQQLPDTLGKDQYTMELGLCMIHASEPYKIQLLQNYHINLENLTGEDGQKLGKLIGFKMASICQDKLLMTKETPTRSSKKENQVFEGKVTKIDREGFIAFSVKNESGKVLRFQWQGFIVSEIDLPSQYGKLIGKKIAVTYHTEELFDWKLAQYRDFNVIDGIRLLK